MRTLRRCCHLDRSQTALSYGVAERPAVRSRWHKAHLLGIWPNPLPPPTITPAARADPGAPFMTASSSWVGFAEVPKLNPRNHPSQQRRPLHQMPHHHMLMRRMSPRPHRAHPIQRRHPPRRRKIPIRPTPGRGLFQLQPHLPRQPPRQPKQRNRPSLPLHRRPVDPPRNRQSTSRIRHPQPPKHPLHPRRIPCPRNPHIHLRHALRRHHIRPSPSRNHPHIHRQPLAQIRKPRHPLHQPSHLNLVPM